MTQEEIDLAALRSERADSVDGFDRQPDRYTLHGGVEVVDVVRAELGDAGFVAFCDGTARVYELRAGKKGPAEIDTRKARWWRQMAEHVRTAGAASDPRSQRRS